jgi:hypothetical protein
MKPDKYFFCKITVMGTDMEVETCFLFQIACHCNAKSILKKFEKNFYGDAKYSRNMGCYLVEGMDIQYTGMDYKKINEQDFQVMGKYLNRHYAK